LSGSQKRGKEEGRAVRLRPFETPPSVVPKGRTSDAPLSALMKTLGNLGYKMNLC